MKKIALLLVLVLVVSMPLSALAATPRADEDYAVELTFSGTTAICRAVVAANHPGDYIVVTMKLFSPNQLVTQWAQTGNGFLEMRKTHTVTKGQTYTLTIDLMINGTSRRSMSVTKTC